MVVDKLFAFHFNPLLLSWLPSTICDTVVWNIQWVQTMALKMAVTLFCMQGRSLTIARRRRHVTPHDAPDSGGRGQAFLLFLHSDTSWLDEIVFPSYFYTKNIIFYLRSYCWLLVTHFLFLQSLSYGVLMYSGCYHKMPQTEWLINNRHLFFVILVAGI